MSSPEVRLIPLGEVLRICALGRSTVYNLLAARQFPRPVKIGRRGVRWRLSDIEEWVESRPLANGTDPGVPE